MTETSRIGVVLSSGGGRGVYAHTGFLLALEQLGVRREARDDDGLGVDDVREIGADEQAALDAHVDGELDDAGWKDSDNDGMRDKEIDGKKVDLKLRYITNQRELRKNVQAVVEQQWKLVGIGVELVNYSSDVFWNGYNDNGPQAQGLYDIAEYSSVPGGFPDPDASGFTCDQIVNADVILVNTCGFLDSAKEESLAAIGEAIAENGRVIVSRRMRSIRRAYEGSRFSHASRLEAVAKARPVRMGPKVGRNDPCPCGSGKKYKKCHGQ